MILIKNVRSEPGGKTISQNQRVIVGTVWTEKFNDFDFTMLDMSQADTTISQNQIEIFGTV